MSNFAGKLDAWRERREEMKKILLVMLIFVAVVMLAQSNPLYKAVDDFKKVDAKVDKAAAEFQKKYMKLG